LSGLSAAYLRALTVYRRALEQRNALLKRAQEAPVGPEAFEAWETPLAQAGATLREIRWTYIDRLNASAPEFHSELAPGEPITVVYAPKDECAREEDLLTALGMARGTDIARGTTTIGPHRDDVQVTIEGRDARLFASQGQQRTGVIALKLAAWSICREDLGFTPLLLLDDILSDLDERRRAALVETLVHHARQAVLTCTEAGAAGPKIMSLAKILRVSAGRVLA
jgi:DNA replication and repair protein RecF